MGALGMRRTCTDINRCAAHPFNNPDPDVRRRLLELLKRTVDSGYAAAAGTQLLGPAVKRVEEELRMLDEEAAGPMVVPVPVVDFRGHPWLR